MFGSNVNGDDQKMFYLINFFMNSKKIHKKIINCEVFKKKQQRT